LGNNFNGCLLTGNIEDKLEFTEIKNSLLNIQNSYKIKCGLKSCVLYKKSKKEEIEKNSPTENIHAFYLWGRFSNEEFENYDHENTCFPFSYKHFPLKNKLIKVSCGDGHLLLVDSTGNLFSMGKGEHGELGLGKDKINTNAPIRIKSFFILDQLLDEANIKFVNCYAGMRSSFAITGICLKNKINFFICSLNSRCK